MSDTLLVGTRKALLIYQKQGDGWSLVRESFVGAQSTYSMVDPRSGTLWACLNHGHWGRKLHSSSDLGKSWEEIESPKYPEGAMIKEEKPATVSYLWTMAAGGSDEPQRLYMGTIPGGLFISDDGGNSWQLNEPLWKHPSREGWFGGGFDEAGIHSIVVDPRDSKRILVGISVAGVFETTDGGESWIPRNRGCLADFLPDPNVEVGHDPHLLDICASQPDVLWQQNHCGIFRSADGCQTWEPVSEKDDTAHFGFAVSCDPGNPETAWVVPAVSDEQRVAVDRALCVCRTDDGGQSWTAFREGLPQSDCYDFVFRHGLSLSGGQLAMGTASGSLYMSDDRGESWHRLAEDLPPVYSVRFVAVAG